MGKGIRCRARSVEQTVRPFTNCVTKGKNTDEKETARNALFQRRDPNNGDLSAESSLPCVIDRRGRHCRRHNSQKESAARDSLNRRCVIRA